VIGGYSLPLDLLVAHSERLRGTLLRGFDGNYRAFSGRACWNVRSGALRRDHADWSRG